MKKCGRREKRDPLFKGRLLRNSAQALFLLRHQSLETGTAMQFSSTLPPTPRAVPCVMDTAPPTPPRSASGSSS